MQSTSITPVIGTVAAGLACVTTAGSATVTSSALFGSVVVGQRVYGAGIPYGATVTAKASTSSITISANATLTGTPTLQFSYFASTAYTAGDCIGWPFKIPLSDVSGIMLVDKSDQMASVVLYVFNSNPNSTPILDNAAFTGISDADAAKIIARYSLTGTTDVGGAKIVYPADAELPLARCGGNDLYGQLVAVGTPTFTAVNEIVLNLTGE